MKEAYKNKEMKAAKKTKKAPAKKLKAWSFPNQSMTVYAETYAEAVEMMKEKTLNPKNS